MHITIWFTKQGKFVFIMILRTSNFFPLFVTTHHLLISDWMHRRTHPALALISWSVCSQSSIGKSMLQFCNNFVATRNRMEHNSWLHTGQTNCAIKQCDCSSMVAYGAQQMCHHSTLVSRYIMENTGLNPMSDLLPCGGFVLIHNSILLRIHPDFN